MAQNHYQAELLVQPERRERLVYASVQSSFLLPWGSSHILCFHVSIQFLGLHRTNRLHLDQANRSAKYLLSQRGSLHKHRGKKNGNDDYIKQGWADGRARNQPSSQRRLISQRKPLHEVQGQKSRFFDFKSASRGDPWLSCSKWLSRTFSRVSYPTPIVFSLKNDQAKYLRKHFVFKIIPMLNPDGVARGYYRLDTLAFNLNRFYLNPSRSEHPTIWAAKKVIV